MKFSLKEVEISLKFLDGQLLELGILLFCYELN